MRKEKDIIYLEGQIDKIAWYQMHKGICILAKERGREYLKGEQKLQAEKDALKIEQEISQKNLDESDPEKVMGILTTLRWVLNEEDQRGIDEILLGGVDT